MQKNKLSYLAAPFSHPELKVRQKRLEIVNRITFELHSKGEFIYSALTHNVPLEKFHNGPCSWNTWEEFDKEMLRRCDALIVLMLPGWEQSVGVKAEVAFAKELGLEIQMIEASEYITVDELDLV